MKKIIFLFYFLCPVFAFADKNVFEYNEHGKHDAFWPLVSSSGTLITYDSDITANDISLEGVVVDAKGNNLAILNGKIVKAGDLVGGYTIDSISNNHVELTKGQEHLTIHIKKGGS